MQKSEFTNTYDTHIIIEKLQERGFTSENAKGILESLDLYFYGRVATSKDVEKVRESIKDLEIQMKKEFITIKWLVLLSAIFTANSSGLVTFLTKLIKG